MTGYKIVIINIIIIIKHYIILSVRDLLCDVSNCLTHKVAICVTYGKCRRSPWRQLKRFNDDSW